MAALEGAAREHGGAAREHGGAAREHGGAAREHGGASREHGGAPREHRREQRGAAQGSLNWQSRSRLKLLALKSITFCRGCCLRSTCGY